jgi:alkylation response protein AidB-like acyl-CoA dehydrogenase
MQALFTEDETLIADSAARLLRGGLERARAVQAGALPPAEPAAALESDWMDLGIPESLGGSGGTLVAAALLMQELGRVVEPVSFGPRFVGRHALLAAGGTPTMAAGRAVLVEHGAWPRVVSGGAVGALLLCQSADGAALDLRAIEAGRAVQGVDGTRPALEVTAVSEPLARGLDAARARAVGATLVAAELCGVARGALELGVAYAKDRVQFGRPIGSYQAIAHRLATVSADTEAAWSLVCYAAWAGGQEAPDAAAAAHAAKAMAGEAALAAAEACIQTHGGIGITAAASPHLYLRRALADDAWLGTAAQHRCALGRLSLGSA